MTITDKLVYNCALVLAILSSAGADSVYGELASRHASGDSVVSWYAAVGVASEQGPWTFAAHVETERERYGDRYTDWDASLRRVGNLTDVGARIDDNDEAGYYTGETWVRLSRQWHAVTFSGGWKGSAASRWYGDVAHYVSVALRGSHGPLAASVEYDRGRAWQLRANARLSYELSRGVTIGPVASIKRYPAGANWHAAIRITWEM